MFKVLTILIVMLGICACSSNSKSNNLDIESVAQKKPSKSRQQLLAEKYNDDWKDEAELFTFDRYLIYFKGVKDGAKGPDGFWYGSIKGDIYVEKGLQRFCCKEVIFKRLGKNKRSLDFLGR